jgi:cephalosporin-C deacetylase-like acetyl esterase
MQKKRLKPPDLLGDAVRLVARFGGYLGRRGDPPPGHQLIWQGYALLRMMCEGYSLKC